MVAAPPARRTARPATRDATERWALLDALPQHIAVLDEMGVVVHVNRAWREYGERQGSTIPDAGVGADYPEVCRNAAASGSADGAKALVALKGLMAGSEDPVSFDYACPSPGDPRWFTFRASRFREGDDIRIMVAHLDVTERHDAQETLRAEHQALGSFNLAVSHDIRAPLRRIQELSRTARSLIYAGEDPTPLLDRLAGEATRARELANDLLDLSYATDVEVRGEPVDVTRMAEEILAGLQSGEPGKDVRATVERGLVTVGDPRLLRLVMRNLLANAWKFSSRAERPEIAVSGRVGEDGEAIFSVRDNGIGFDPANASKLFHPFTRLPGAQGFEGTGIGLSIVQRAIERLGGSVWAHGVPGEGATFEFSLP